MPGSMKISSLLLRLKSNLFTIGFFIPAFLYLFSFFVIILVFLLKFSFSGNLPLLSLFSSPEFKQALWRSFYFMGVGTPLQLAVGLLLALLIQHSFKGVGAVRSLFMIPIAIPALVTAIIIDLLFSYPFGPVNDLLLGRHGFFPQAVSFPVNWSGSEFLSLGLAILGKTWRDMPISMLILLAGLHSIDREQYEAAKTMGAGAWQEFKYLTLPLLTPAILTILILRSIENWKEFVFPFVLAPSYPLLGVLIERLYHVEQNPALAASVALGLVILIALTTLLFTAVTRLVRRHLVRV
ncbi:MAG: sugar ABC transporter permease [Candidatus Zixiibacteriota bacterium]